MDLNWLRDFECLARTLNFTRAADERNITQSAFSRRIKGLENWVGLALINRATYPIQLTEAGRQFLPSAQAAILHLVDTRQAIRDADDGGNSFVRISALHTISVNYLSSRLDVLQQEIDDFRVRVISDSLSSCCELLAEGAVDIMLCYDHPAVSPRIDDNNFNRKNVHTERLLPVALKEQVELLGWNLADTKKRPIPYLAYEQSSFLGTVADSLISQKTKNLDVIYIDGLVETIKRRLMNGNGFAWMPETAIETELAAGALVPIGNESSITKLKIAAYTNPTGLSGQTKAVWELL